MKVFVCTNSFEGSLTAEEVSVAVGSACEKRGYECEMFCLPYPKGFSAYCAERDGGKILPTKYPDVNFFLKNGEYAVTAESGIVSTGELFSIEDTMIKDPLCGSSKGLGEVVKNILVLKKKKLIVALSDCCCFDCGVGFLAALGGKFYNEAGEEFLPTAATLKEIKKSDLSEPKRLLKDVGIELFVDKCRTLKQAVSDGRAFGARSSDIKTLEDNISYLVSQTDVFNRHSDFVGAGEGGGLCYAMVSLFSAKISLVSDLFFDRNKESVDSSDLVFTGGCGYFYSAYTSDWTDRIVTRCKEENKRVFAFSDDDRYGRGSGLYSPDKTRKENRALLPGALYEKIELALDRLGGKNV